MQKPKIPFNETNRQQSLESYNILDTLPEKDFDDITSLAAAICQSPICLISLVDNERQWFKSKVGLNADETAREISFCAHAINNPSEPFIVNDARSDARFMDNPLVTGGTNVVFYAGAPILSTDGFALGSLCVIDQKPRELTNQQIESLLSLSRQVTAQLELRKQNKDLITKSIQIEIQNEELKRFAQVVAHDLKSPLQSVRGSLELIIEKESNISKDEIVANLIILQNRCKSMEQFVSGLLNYTKADGIEIFQEPLKISSLIDECITLSCAEADVCFEKNIQVENFTGDELLFKQMMLNLITNAIKYNNKENPIIKFSSYVNDKGMELVIEDNGCGIPLEKHIEVFEIFKTNNRKDKYGNKGNGIGLATVKRIVERMGGDISIDSNYTDGVRFVIQFMNQVEVKVVV